MDKHESKNHNEKTAGLPTYVRIKDHHGHFLGEVQRGVVRIYCKKCKEFFEVPINQFFINGS